MKPAQSAIINEPLVQIDKGVPLPPAGHGRGGPPPKYPFAIMGTGDSFLFSPEIKEQCARVRVSKANAHYFPHRYTLRKTPEGMRCWRIY